MKIQNEENNIKIAVQVDMTQLDLAIEKAEKLALLMEKTNSIIRQLVETERV